MSTANDLTQKAKEVFMHDTRDLLAFTRAGANDCFKRIAAALMLDPEAQSDCLLYSDILDQKAGYARDQARDDFRNAMHAAICKAFLKILRNGAIEFVGKLTTEAQDQLELIEVLAGERAPQPVAPPPPPPKSAQEQLEDQVIADYNTLPTDKMRAKLNSNIAYRETFNRLSESNKLESQITAFHDHGAEFRR
jgi:hypothetical protein